MHTGSNKSPFSLINSLIFTSYYYVVDINGLLAVGVAVVIPHTNLCFCCGRVLNKSRIIFHHNILNIWSIYYGTEKVSGSMVGMKKVFLRLKGVELGGN